jgi:hypothetical protein
LHRTEENRKERKNRDGQVCKNSTNNISVNQYIFHFHPG